MIRTVVGTGTAGYTGDGGPAADATLNHPRDLEIGPEGDLYIADTDNGRIRAIDLSSGTIRTVVGTGDLGYTKQEEVEPTTLQLHRTFGVDFDPEGNLYVSDSLNSRIVKVNK